MARDSSSYVSDSRKVISSSGNEMRAFSASLIYLIDSTIFGATQEVGAMVRKTFSSYVPFVALLILLDTSLWGRGTKNGLTEEKVPLTVSVYNEAGVPGEVLSRAEAAASRIFQRAGIAVSWLNCEVRPASKQASTACLEVAFPKHLQLRIVRKSAGLNGEAMGLSFQGEDGIGCLADLFYGPMEELERSEGTDIASLLGHVAAHELGHLLLGSHSHAVAGIMQARWTTDELTSAEAARMVFLDQESQKMKGRLLGRREASGPVEDPTSSRL